jgi:hypothetical protein
MAPQWGQMSFTPFWIEHSRRRRFFSMVHPSRIYDMREDGKGQYLTGRITLWA